jgi:hypothetical protein
LRYGGDHQAVHQQRRHQQCCAHGEDRDARNCSSALSTELRRVLDGEERYYAIRCVRRNQQRPFRGVRDGSSTTEQLATCMRGRVDSAGHRAAGQFLPGGLSRTSAISP